jgi:hypothetical protein
MPHSPAVPDGGRGSAIRASDVILDLCSLTSLFIFQPPLPPPPSRGPSRAKPYRAFLDSLSLLPWIDCLFCNPLSNSVLPLLVLLVDISAIIFRLLWHIMADFNNPNWWMDLGHFQPTAFLQYNEISFNHTANATPPDDTTSGNTSDTICNTRLEGTVSPQSKKRRQTSECSQSEALVRPRKTRKLRSPHETAKIREKGACFLCKKKRKEVNLIY